MRKFIFKPPHRWGHGHFFLILFYFLVHLSFIIIPFSFFIFPVYYSSFPPSSCVVLHTSSFICASFLLYCIHPSSFWYHAWLFFLPFSQLVIFLRFPYFLPSTFHLLTSFYFSPYLLIYFFLCLFSPFFCLCRDAVSFFHLLYFSLIGVLGPPFLVISFSL